MTPENITDSGGESACYAHLVCAACGAVLDDQSHDATCLAAPPLKGTSILDAWS